VQKSLKSHRTDQLFHSWSLHNYRDGILDYRRYVRFQLLTPSAKKLPNGKYEVHPNWSKVETLTLDHCRFCYDFVIESAIELQAIDLEVKVVPTYQRQIFDESFIQKLFSESDSNSDQTN